MSGCRAPQDGQGEDASRGTATTPPSEFTRCACRVLDSRIPVIQKLGVPCRTLPGIVRETELIPWDHDMDLGVDGRHAEEFFSTVWTPLPRYCVCKRASTDWAPRLLRSAVRT